MLSGVTSIACAIVGTAVLRIVVSSDCMKKATATSHGSSRLLVSVGAGSLKDGVAMFGRWAGRTTVTLRRPRRQSPSTLVGDLVVGLDTPHHVLQLGIAQQRRIKRHQRLGERVAVDIVDHLDALSLRPLARLEFEGVEGCTHARHRILGGGTDDGAGDWRKLIPDDP